MAGWERVKWSARPPARPKWTFEGHAWKADRPVAKLTSRAICIHCGLLRLRNLLTDWCVRQGCNYEDHPGYTQAMRRLPAEHEHDSNSLC